MFLKEKLAKYEYKSPFKSSIKEPGIVPSDAMEYKRE